MDNKEGSVKYETEKEVNQIEEEKDKEELSNKSGSQSEPDSDSQEDNEESENAESSAKEGALKENELALDRGKTLKETQSIKKVEAPVKKELYIRRKVREILELWAVQITMTGLTVYILFADDIKMLATPASADDYFSGICLGLMCLFGVELIISALVNDNYVFGFYFWLDIVSLISMLLDIHWFYATLVNMISQSTGNIKSIAAIAKAGRGAKIGSRAVRILRILRIIRLVRISKIYKASEKYLEASMKKKKKEEQKKNAKYNKVNPGDGKNNIEMANMNQDENERNEENTKPGQAVPEESKVGKKLSDLTTRRVIILVLSMMIGIILFKSSFYYEMMNSMDFGMKIFEEFDTVNDPNFNLTYNIYINEHLNISTPIIFFQISNKVYGNFDDTLYLRDDEKIISSTDCITLNTEYVRYFATNTTDDDSILCLSIFDNRSSSKLSAILNIVKTIFICIVLAGGSICFSKDTTEMVIEPIESMIHKIKQISKNPIEAMQNIEKEDYLKTILNEQDKKTKCCRAKGKKEAPLETVILEKTISKIGALLALGFGEAGSEIIAKNMTNNSNGEVNPMIPGKKVMAIYGFCDIRNFTDTTEVLQEKVMIFVNEIAEIVHEITSDYCGSANKNIGDAFLLVWKFNENWVITEDNGELSFRKDAPVSPIVDMAVIAFLKILSKVHKSFKLDKYRRNEKLNERINNYAVKMGFGLHLGYSIEGAIGSTFKIDASYLSPNVNEASKLEEKTKEYGVQLIISEQFVNHMSEEARKKVRILDVLATSDGQKNKIYTVDFDLKILKIEEKDPDDDQKNDVDNMYKKLIKYHKRNKRKDYYTDAISGKINVWNDYVEHDPDFVLMRKKFTDSFYEMYNNGFREYESGDWMQAKKFFEMAESVMGEKDGPTSHLLSLMKEYGFKRPADWVGNSGGHDH